MQEIIDIVSKIANLLTPLIMIFGLIATMTNSGKDAIARWFKKVNEPQCKAIICVLRSDIRKMCRDCLKQGFMSDEDLENISEASEAYEGLGGNSYTKSLVKRALELPVKKVGDDQ